MLSVYTSKTMLKVVVTANDAHCLVVRSSSTKPLMQSTTIPIPRRKAKEPSSVLCECGQRREPKQTPKAAAQASPTPMRRMPLDCLNMLQHVGVLVASGLSRAASQTGKAQPSKRYR